MLSSSSFVVGALQAPSAEGGANVSLPSASMRGLGCRRVSRKAVVSSPPDETTFVVFAAATTGHTPLGRVEHSHGEQVA